MNYLKQIKRNLKFIKSLWSPFKPFKLKWYIGKIAVGTPYFYPRKWVKGTPELALKATLDYIEREKRYNELNPNYARKLRSFNEVYNKNLRSLYPVPKKIGFDFINLGYKTKWSDIDYRFEWSPGLSFVFFGYQIAVKVVVPETSHYWESWLYYENNTDKSKSKRDRINQCKQEFPLIYKVSQLDKKDEIVDYYNLILRKKYLK